MSLGKTTLNSLETSMWETPKTRVSYHLHGKKQKFWLQNQMVCTLLFELGSFRKNIWTVFWGDAIFPPFSVGYPSCSGSPSHHVKFYGFMFMQKISTQVVCVNGKHPDFKATAIHQLSKTSIPFAYLSDTATNKFVHAFVKFCLTIYTSCGDHVRLPDLPAQLNAFLLSEVIGCFSWFSLFVWEIWKSTTPMDGMLYCKRTVLSPMWSILVKSPEPRVA